MAQHNELGKQGESMAVQYLVEHGFAILKTNWRRGKYEVDIVAYQEGLIVFCEVKTRSSAEHGNPEDFVDRKKQQAYIRMANAFVIENQREEEVRFDIFSIIITPSASSLTHLPGAFSAVGQRL